MFNNARHYNQETSQVYKDAETLERILRLKVRSFPSAATAALDGTAQAQALLHKKYVVTISVASVCHRRRGRCVDE